MTRQAKMIKKIKELMYEPQKIRNIGICAHIDHEKPHCPTIYWQVQV